MRYRVWHRTTYTYDEDVSNSYGIAHVEPRSTSWQQVDSVDVRIEPTPGDASRDIDFYGNAVSYFQVTEPHRTLVVDATSEVEVQVPTYDADALATPWEQARPGERSDVADAWRAVDFALPSTLVDQTEQAHAYAAESLTPGRPVGEAVTELMHRIHADFRYDKTATTVTSRIDDVFEQRAGVCQDFAHLTLSCLRSHGLAVAYVSGYLATTPPPGRERVVGADASHAWAAVWLPDGSWLALDPTNDHWADDRYVTVARGRDYKDVPPVKGIIYTDARSSSLDVQVDVAPLV
ncbi:MULTISPECIES: transglutaminase N-terminal domain-containing protein [unclassified Aeromicrobium]|uniref:transglutaminase family protein n=1 Tax=unclassified Aeromicrobium TaxID=2633570 RepID=UPI00396B42C3